MASIESPLIMNEHSTTLAIDNKIIVPKQQGFKFLIAGIGDNKMNRMVHCVADIDTENTCTISTSLMAHNTIKTLDLTLHSALNIPIDRELLILHANREISGYVSNTLAELGVTNNSLLTVLISRSSTPASSKAQKKPRQLAPLSKFSMPECTTGLDVITQEIASLYKMPDCTHCMNKESLYDFCCSHLTDISHYEITCPHAAEHEHHEKQSQDHETVEIVEEKKDVVEQEEEFIPWGCLVCTFMNAADAPTCVMCQQGTRQDSIRAIRERETEATLQPVARKEDSSICRQPWSYAKIKQILLDTQQEALERDQVISSKLKKLLSKWYDLQHTFWALTYDKMRIRPAFRQSIKDLETKLRTEYFVESAPLSKITAKANRDAKEQNYDCGSLSLGKKYQVDELCAKLELMASRNYLKKHRDIQACSKCHTLYYDECDHDHQDHEHDHNHEHDETFCVVCNEKNSSFCWECGEDWSDGHFCDSRFRDEIVKILAAAETKTIGPVNDVPSIRSCPRCAQMCHHIEACKHMVCGSCKLNFCFVCLKPTIKGEWQCGSHGDPCPVAPPQKRDDLPNTSAILKKSFRWF